MPNIIITEDDLKKMDPELRENLIVFINQTLLKKETGEIKLPEIPLNGLSTVENYLLEFKTPTVITIEGAYSILMGLNKNCLEFIKKLLMGKFIQFKNTYGVSKEEMSDSINVSEASLNGIVGSINRRFKHRFNNKVYNVIGGNTLSTHPQSGPFNSTKLIYYDPSSRLGFINYYWLSNHKDNFLNFEIAIKLLEMKPNFETYNYKISIFNKNLEKQIEFFLDDTSITSFDHGKGYVTNYENKIESGLKSKKNEYLDTYMCTEQICHSIQKIQTGIEYTEIGPRKFNFGTMKFDSEKGNKKILTNFKFDVNQVEIEKHKKS